MKIIGIALKGGWRINLPDHLTRSTDKPVNYVRLPWLRGIELMNRNRTEIGGNYQ